MGARIRGLSVLVVVLLVGAFLGSAFREWSPPRGARVPAPGTGILAPDERVRVEVRNGGGIPGRAREAKDQLRNRGFDVVYYGNERPFGRDSSVVLDRIGRPDWARSVAEALGIVAVREELDPNLLLDVSVVLGRDWEPELPSSASPGATAWWDLRRFFGTEPSRLPSADVDRLADPGGGGE